MEFNQDNLRAKVRCLAAQGQAPGWKIDALRALGKEDELVQREFLDEEDAAAVLMLNRLIAESGPGAKKGEEMPWGTRPRMTLDDFKHLSGATQLTHRETMAAYNHAGLQAALQDGKMTKLIAISFLAQIRGRIQTTSKAAFMNSKGLILDGDVMAQGQAKSSLYFAFRGARVVCAKVYNYTDEHLGASSQVAARNEESVSKTVHEAFICPTLIKVEQLIENARHGVLVLPMMGRSCSDLLTCIHPQPLPDICTGTICISSLSAVAALALSGLCHGDIKPSNIMLPTGEGHVTVIDLASCTPYNDRLTEISEQYALGLQPHLASLKWDLVCTAATLYTFSGSTGSTLPKSWEQLREDLSFQLTPGEQSSLCLQLCLIILLNVDATVEQLKDWVWLPCLQLVEQKLGAEVAGALQGTWPAAIGRCGLATSEEV